MRFCKTKSSEDNVLLFLAIRTPLISRVYQHVQLSGELVSLIYNNPMFVVSTSSAAGGLPLGVVVTSDETTSTINTALTQLHSLLHIGSLVLRA